MVKVFASQNCSSGNQSFSDAQLISIVTQGVNDIENIIDSEISLFCDSSNSNAPVIVQYQFPTQTNTGTLIPVKAWNIDGTLFTGVFTDLVACGTGEIAGSVIANAGTNLNTSLLALESGGNIAAILAALANTFTVTNGKTPLKKTGTASGTFTIVPAVATKKIKVYSLSLMTAATSLVTITFKDGAAGNAIGTYILQALPDTNFGIAEGVSIPSFLFDTTAGNLLEMSFSSGLAVTYNLRYWADDAT